MLGAGRVDTICTAACVRCDSSTACRLCRLEPSMLPSLWFLQCYHHFGSFNVTIILILSMFPSLCFYSVTIILILSMFPSLCFYSVTIILVLSMLPSLCFYSVTIIMVPSMLPSLWFFQCYHHYGSFNVTIILVLSMLPLNNSK